MGDEIDQEIAKFHDAARRRNMIIFSITSIICLAIGASILIVMFASAEDAPRGVARWEGRTLIFGIGFIVAGGISAATAIGYRKRSD